MVSRVQNANSPTSGLAVRKRAEGAEAKWRIRSAASSTELQNLRCDEDGRGWEKRRDEQIHGGDLIESRRPDVDRRNAEPFLHQTLVQLKKCTMSDEGEKRR